MTRPHQERIPAERRDAGLDGDFADIINTLPDVKAQAFEIIGAHTDLCDEAVAEVETLAEIEERRMAEGNYLIDPANFSDVIAPDDEAER